MIKTTNEAETDHSDDEKFYDAPEQPYTNIMDFTALPTEDSDDYHSADEKPYLPTQKEIKQFSYLKSAMFCDAEESTEKITDNRDKLVSGKKSFLTDHSNLLYQGEDGGQRDESRCSKKPKYHKNVRRWIDRGVEKMKMALSKEGMKSSIPAINLNKDNIREDIVTFKDLFKFDVIELITETILTELKSKLQKSKTQTRNLQKPTPNETLVGENGNRSQAPEKKSSKRRKRKKNRKMNLSIKLESFSIDWMNNTTTQGLPMTYIIQASTSTPLPTVFRNKLIAEPDSEGVNLRVSTEQLRNMDTDAVCYVVRKKQERQVSQTSVVREEEMLTTYDYRHSSTTNTNNTLYLGDQDLHLQAGDDETIKVTVNINGNDVLTHVLGKGASISKLTKHPVFRSIVARYIPKDKDFVITRNGQQGILKTLEEDCVLKIHAYNDKDINSGYF